MIYNIANNAKIVLSILIKIKNNKKMNYKIHNRRTKKFQAYNLLEYKALVLINNLHKKT